MLFFLYPPDTKTCMIFEDHLNATGLSSPFSSMEKTKRLFLLHVEAGSAGNLILLKFPTQI